MLNTILIIIIALCLGGIIFIVIKKMSHIAVIDVATIPEEKEKKVQEQIIAKRAKEKATKYFVFIKKIVKPVIIGIQKGFSLLFDKLKNLEDKYKIKKEPVTREEIISLEQKIKKLIEDAEEYIKQEEYGEAEKKYIEAISLDDSNTEAFKGLGNVYMFKKDYEQAEETYKYILKLDQKDEKIEKEEGAEQDKKAAIHYYDLGLVRKEMGKIKQAKEDLIKALRLEPNNPKYLDFLIELCIILGDKDDAKMYIAKLKEVNPDNSKIEEYKAKVKDI
ncbi:tetratricopeptide repeat protein [Candidatus Falkowbacteria bacterium]|nr:tetratricopeptide repeat protein [Candidatus Falkowbacteria bacterium]